MSGKADKVSSFITSLVMHFPVRHESDEREAEWLRAMTRTLRDYDASVLAGAAALLIETRRDRRFPLPAECRDACAEIIKRKNAERPAGLPLDKKFPEWSDDRLRMADDLVQTDLGRRAAREGWILALWNFARENLRLPSGPEIARCIASSKDFDEAYERLVRDPSIPLAPNLIRLGDSMLARRERLRALVLEGVIA